MSIQRVSSKGLLLGLLWLFPITGVSFGLAQSSSDEFEDRGRGSSQQREQPGGSSFERPQRTDRGSSAERADEVRDRRVGPPLHATYAAPRARGALEAPQEADPRIIEEAPAPTEELLLPDELPSTEESLSDELNEDSFEPEN